MTSFFSSSQVTQWRILSHLEDWQITKPWREKPRKIVATLDPPFIPEDEVLIFDAPVWSGWGGASIRIKEVYHKGKSLKDGYLLATDSRLVFGDSNAKWVSQISYESIKAINTNKDDYTLVLADETQLLIRAKVPRSSLLGTIAILGGSPRDRATISRMEQNKEEIAQHFVSLFSGFFTEIIDENRKRDRG